MLDHRRPDRRSAAAMLLVSLIVAALPWVVGGSSPVRAGADACDNGWGPSVGAPGLHDVLELGDGRAVAVGSVGLPEDGRQTTSRWWDGTAWDEVAGPPTEGDSVLLAVAGSLPDRVWAVGFRRTGRTSHALAMRWVDGAWVPVSLPPRASGTGQTLAAVDVDPDGGVWAVGQVAVTGPVRDALVLRRAGGVWTRPDLPTLPGSALTAVRAIASDDVWAVGSRLTSTGIRPLAIHWDGTTWSRVTLPASGADAVLSGLSDTPDGTVWAAGRRMTPDGMRPLLLTWGAGSWAVAEAPDVGGTFALLTDVSVDAAGRVWVVGTSYRGPSDRYVPVVARHAAEGDGWTIWPRPSDGDRWGAAVTGDPTTTGWIVGRTTAGSFLRRLCPLTAGRAGTRDRRPAARRSAGARFGPAGRPIVDDERPRLPKPLAGLQVVPGLPPPTSPTSVVARDIASEVGLTYSGPTHGADAGDLDGDGDLDLFISHHGQLPALWLRSGDGYERQAQDGLDLVDRHDCAIGRVDPGPRPDVVCSVGADGGLGLKANELWLDPAEGIDAEVGAERGIADPFGRGRELELFDADGDGDLDLLLGTLAMRFDGNPSPNRLLRNDGTGRFRWDPGSGLTSDRGAACIEATDLDRDGDLDLVVCGASSGIVLTSRIVVYRNEAGRFRDATAELGVTPIGEVAAASGQLGGTARPDLVQLSLDRIRVSLWRDGRYRPVFERTLTAGRGVALGDADGDGDLDIYLLRGNGTVNQPDLVLLNDGTGRGWQPITIPSTTAGTAESVLALDHDGNGMTDFLVLNGWVTWGPIQLIAFIPAP